MKNIQCDNLTLLVGSNPLPNYISTAMMRPTKLLYLLYTEENENNKGTRKIMERLKNVLEDNVIVTKAQIKPLAISPNRGWKLMDELREHNCPCEKNDYLNYTGGTKAMSAYSVLNLVKRKTPDYSFENLCYLDDQSNNLIIDNKLELSIAEYFDQGLIPWKEDLLFKLHFDSNDYRLLTTEEKDKLPKNEFEEQIKKVVRNIQEKTYPFAKFYPNYKIKKTDRKRQDYCEIDSVIVIQGRIYFISMYEPKDRTRIETKDGNIKNKIWEIFYWSKFLGGDLARASFITSFDDVSHILKDQIPHDWQNFIIINWLNKNESLLERKLLEWFKK